MCCGHRLGFIIDFLSHAAIVGFMAGAAITIGLQQLNGLLGIKTGLFTNKTGFIAVMQSVFQKPIEVSPPSCTRLALLLLKL